MEMEYRKTSRKNTAKRSLVTVQVDESVLGRFVQTILVVFSVDSKDPVAVRYSSTTTTLVSLSHAQF